MALNFGTLKTLARKVIPGAQASKINNTVLEQILNDGKDDVNSRLLALKKNKKFDINAEQQDYLLSTIAPDYLTTDKSGVYWYDGDKWFNLDDVTREYMDLEFTRWRDDESGEVRRYFIEEDTLTFHRKPDTTLTEGGWIYYIRRAETMTNSDDFPFHIDGNKKVEVPQFTILGWAILAYWRWKAAMMLGKSDPNTINTLEEAYYRNLQDMNSRLKVRLDILYGEETKYQGHIFNRSGRRTFNRRGSFRRSHR
jgi:hypothetical protein